MKTNSQKLTVTVGIPAYNEQWNIENILRAVQKQKEEGFVLEKIIVLSDCSTDVTVEKARALAATDPRIEIVEGNERRGKSARMNELFERSETDIIIIFDADIDLVSDTVVHDLVMPMKNDQSVQVVFGRSEPRPPTNFIQHVIFTGWEIWDDIRTRTHGAEMYRCEGTIRAFRRELYNVMRFPNFSADDVFPFLYCRKYGYQMSSAAQAVVCYALPTTYRDYLRQSVRFLGSKKIQKRSFDPGFVERFYVIRGKDKIRALITHGLRKPFLVFSYLAFLIPPKIISLFKTAESRTPLWEIATSTKNALNIPAIDARKKIIFSNYDDIKNPIYGGGGSFAVHEVAKHLATNFQVEVLTGRYPHATDDNIDGVQYWRIGTSLFGARVGQLFFHFVLPFYVFFKKYDLWIESFTPPFSTSFTPLFTRKPVIGLVHMLSAKDMSRKYHLPFTLIENLGLKYYSHFITLTKESALQIKQHNPSADVQIIGNGTDVPVAPNEADDKQGKHLSFIGRVEIDQKGLDLLLTAYTEILKEVDLPLVIAGAGSSCETARLKKLIHAHGLTDKVKLLGRISGAQKEEFYRKTFIGLVPSRYETSPLVVLEMMSYGIPVIGFDIPGLAWASRSAVVQVPSFDTQLFAQAVIDLVRDKVQYKAISVNARIAAEGRSWGIVSEKYKQYIETVLASPSSHYVQDFFPRAHLGE